MNKSRRFFIKKSLVLAVSMCVLSGNAVYAEEVVTRDNYIYKNEILDKNYQLILRHTLVPEKAKRDILRNDYEIIYNNKAYVVKNEHNFFLLGKKGKIVAKGPTFIQIIPEKINNLKVKVDDVVVEFNNDTVIVKRNNLEKVYTVIVKRNNLEKVYKNESSARIIYDFERRVIKYLKNDKLEQKESF